MDEEMQNCSNIYDSILFFAMLVEENTGEELQLA